MNVLGVVSLAGCFFFLTVLACDVEECCKCKGIYIRNKKSGLVISVRSEDLVLLVMEKPRGSCEQIWEYKEGMLYNKKSGLVLSASLVGDAQISILFMDIPNGNANQKWTFLGNGAIKSGNNFTLDVFSFRTTPGTEVIGYFQTHLGHNQIFEAVPVP